MHRFAARARQTTIIGPTTDAARRHNILWLSNEQRASLLAVPLPVARRIRTRQSASRKPTVQPWRCGHHPVCKWPRLVTCKPSCLSYPVLPALVDDARCDSLAGPQRTSSTCCPTFQGSPAPEGVCMGVGVGVCANGHVCVCGRAGVRAWCGYGCGWACVRTTLTQLGRVVHPALRVAAGGDRALVAAMAQQVQECAKHGRLALAQTRTSSQQQAALLPSWPASRLHSHLPSPICSALVAVTTACPFPANHPGHSHTSAPPATLDALTLALVLALAASSQASSTLHRV